MYEFRKCVNRYNGNFRSRTFSCFDQFLCMAFAQLTYRESLRDIETCLRSFQDKLYHAGFRGKISRSTLADANENRNWQIYSDFAHVLIQQARPLYQQDDFGVTLNQTAYAFDATTIDLCLSVFPWATGHQSAGGIKVHTLLDLRGNIPCFISVERENLHEVNIIDRLSIEAGSIYIMDRGYFDYRWLYLFTQNASYFIIRAKKNINTAWLASRPVDTSMGLRCDQSIRFKHFYAAKNYPDALRRIHFIDPLTNRHFIYLTNNFLLPAFTITELYKCRWRVELFFKWIKQYLRIKAFYGTSANAVRTQIWIAISIYVLMAIIKKKLALSQSLGEILQVLSVTLFEKIPLPQLLLNFHPEQKPPLQGKQLILFAS